MEIGSSVNGSLLPIFALGGAGLEHFLYS